MTHSDLVAILYRIVSYNDTLSKLQEAFAIRDIGRVRVELSDMLAEFADSDGIIKRRRAGMVLRELDAIEAMIREHGTLALNNNIVEECSESTIVAINKGVGITISSVTFNAVIRHVVIYAST